MQDLKIANQAAKMKIEAKAKLKQKETNKVPKNKLNIYQQKEENQSITFSLIA